MRKIASHYLINSGRLLSKVVITLDDNNVIIGVEDNVKDIDSKCGVEFYNGILIAGMINCHNHLEYSYVKGMIPAHSGLPNFISTIISIKQKNEVDDLKKTEMADIWDNVMYNEGVTAVGDHNNNDYVYSVKKNSKIYYHSFVEIFDMDGMSAEDTFKFALKRVETSKKYGIHASVSPHACYTMEPRLVRLTGGEDALDDGTRAEGIVSVHFKESLVLGGENERDIIIGSLSDKRDKVLLVHCIYADKEDMSAAKDKFGDKLTAVVCPCSNMYIEQNIADVNMFKDLGIRIALGTDSLSSNTTLSMVEEMKCIQQKYDIPLTEVVKWATINGAEALGIDSWAGSIEIGKKPGLVLLSGVDMQTMKFTDKTKGRRII